MVRGCSEIQFICWFNYKDSGHYFNRDRGTYVWAELIISAPGMTNVNGSGVAVPHTPNSQH